MKIKTKKPDPKWVQLARARGFTLKTGAPEFLPLKKILLNIGGWGVCVPSLEPDLEKIILRGQRFSAKSISMKGEPCQCHSNSAYCWDANRKHCTICTGYALSRDGMWRQHSWCYGGKVIETTEKRAAYWGFLMTEDECERFLDYNL